MDNILKITNELASQIKACDSMQRYKAAKSSIEADADLSAKLRAFKQAQVAFEWKAMQGEARDFNEARYVSKLYTDLMLDDDAKTFLVSEREILTLIAQIHSAIDAACEIDIGF